jgi:hypothetical protein
VREWISQKALLNCHLARFPISRKCATVICGSGALEEFIFWPSREKICLQAAQKISGTRRAKNRRAEAYIIGTLERGD